MATSASLRTTNYALHKYASIDEVKILQDFNVNMDLIDAAVHTVAETLDVTTGVVSDNVTRLDGVDDSVEALQTAVNTANTTANSALSASGTANAGVAVINAFNTKITAAHGHIDGFSYAGCDVITKRSGRVDGSLYISNPSAVASLSTIATIPDGFRPSEYRYINASCGNGSGSYIPLPVRIDTNGVISCRVAVGAGQPIVCDYGFSL